MFSQARISPDCTGYEPTKGLLFLHQKPSTSAVLTPQCRVAIVAYSREGGYSLKILDEDVTSGSPISLSPISNPKHDSFLTCFQTSFLKVLLSFVNQLPYLT